MVWICEVCTFANRNDDWICCEICESRRSTLRQTSKNVLVSQQSPSIVFAHNKESKQLKKSIQTTLFGAIAKVQEKKAVIPSKKGEATDRQHRKNEYLRSDVLKESSTTYAGSAIAKVQGKKAVVTSNECESTDRKLKTNEDPKSNNEKESSTSSAFESGIVSSSCNAMRQEQFRHFQKEEKKLPKITERTIKELASHAKVVMKNVFGVRRLRSLQPDAVTCSLKRESQIIIMATGGGKVRLEV
jgi:hypothetical protein